MRSLEKRRRPLLSWSRSLGRYTIHWRVGQFLGAQSEHVRTLWISRPAFLGLRKPLRTGAKPASGWNSGSVESP
eukprot:8171987-Pyramimonas_sp.AAC.1